MPQVVRSRVRALHGPPPVAPVPRRFRSLADREAVAVLHRAARVLLEALPELTDRLVEALREQEPAYRSAIEADAAEIWQEVHHSLRHNVASLIQPREFREAAHRTSRRIGEIRAEQGLPLDAVLHAFRMGGAMVWQDLVDETAHRHPDDIRLLVHVAADVWNFVDEHCGVVADAYRQAERRLAWRRENRQRLMTAALLDGTAQIAELPDAAAMLGLPEHGRYAVLAVATARRAPHGTAHPPMTLPAGVDALWHPGPDAEFAIVPLAREEVAAELAAPGPDPAGTADPLEADGAGRPAGAVDGDAGLGALAAGLSVPPVPGSASAPSSRGWRPSGTPVGSPRPPCGPARPVAGSCCSTNSCPPPWSSRPPGSARPSPPGCWGRWTGWTPPTATYSSRRSRRGSTPTARPSGQGPGSTATATRS